MGIRLPWWRDVTGRFTIEGRRLDASAPPLRVSILGGDYSGFKASVLIFPTEGCWEVTGRVADRNVTFVVRVVKVDEEKKR